jgi:hypothetical protein
VSSSSDWDRLLYHHMEVTLFCFQHTMATKITIVEISLNTQDFLLSGFILKVCHTLRDFLDSTINWSTTVWSIIFWDVTVCSQVEVHQHFRGTYWLHLQSWRVLQARNQQQAELFSHEDGRSTFLRNITGLVPNYTALCLRRQYPS